MKKLLVQGIAISAVPGIFARKWPDIVPSSELNPIDPLTIEYLVRTDPFSNGDLLPPQPIPQAQPSNNVPATSAPVASPNPTKPPTDIPSNDPTGGPTEVPTDAPTGNPTLAPSSAPTEPVEPYPENPVPRNPRPWYFNYNTSDSSDYGPGTIGLVPSGGTFQVGVKNNHWGSVQQPPNDYWVEFTDNGWGPW